MPSQLNCRASVLAASLWLLVVPSCGGGDGATAGTSASSTASATTGPEPESRPPMRAVESKAVLAQLLSAAGVRAGPVTTDGATVVESAWRAFRAFAAIEIDDPFMADAVAEEGDAYMFEARPASSEEHGGIFELAFVRRFKFEDFAGDFARQEQVKVAIQLAASDQLASVAQPPIWSFEQAGSDRASQLASWERAVESSEAFRRAIAEGATPLRVEVTREEGDIH